MCLDNTCYPQIRRPITPSSGAKRNPTGSHAMLDQAFPDIQEDKRGSDDEDERPPQSIVGLFPFALLIAQNTGLAPKDNSVGKNPRSIFGSHKKLIRYKE